LYGHGEARKIANRLRSSRALALLEKDTVGLGYGDSHTSAAVSAQKS
jgi:hypothetical protein